MAANDGGIFVGMANNIMDGFNVVLSGLTDFYGNALTPVLMAFFALFIIWRGYQIMAGQATFQQMLWDAGRFAIVLTFVGNSDGWYQITVSAIDGIRDGLSGKSGSVWVLLDSAWDKTQAIASELNSLDDSIWVGSGVRGALAELIVWCGVGFMLLCAAFINITAQLTLMLLMTTGPIFIACLLFGWLRDMFSNWVKEIVGCVLTVLFSSLSLQVAMNYLTKTLNAATIGAESSNIITLAVQCSLAAIGAGFVVLLSWKIAGSLAGASVQAATQGMAKAGIMSAGAASGAAVAGTAKTLAKSSPDPRLSETGYNAPDAASGYMNTRQLRNASIEKMKHATQLSIQK